MKFTPYYTGHFVVSGVTHKGLHQPMVTAGEFSRVQELLARGGGHRRHTNDFVYTGLLECARCGCRVTAEMQTGTYKPGRYVYYHCSNRLGGCSKVGIREEALEARIEALLGRVTIGREVADFALAAVEKWQEGVASAGAHVADQQEDALAETQRQIEALLDLRLQSSIADDLFKRKQSELQDRATKLRLAHQDTAEELARVQASARGAIRFMAGSHALFLVGTVREKREIARALGLRYAFDRGTVSIEVNPALPPHLALAPEAPEDTPSQRPKKGRFELGIIGSESTKNAAFCAAFSFGGPIETLSERLWQFFSVKPSFVCAPCLGNDVQDRSAGCSYWTDA